MTAASQPADLFRNKMAEARPGTRELRQGPGPDPDGTSSRRLPPQDYAASLCRAVCALYGWSIEKLRDRVDRSMFDKLQLHYCDMCEWSDAFGASRGLLDEVLEKSDQALSTIFLLVNICRIVVDSKSYIPSCVT